MVVPFHEHLLVLPLARVDFGPNVDDVVHQNVLLQQARYFLEKVQGLYPDHFSDEVALDFRDSGVGKIRSLVKCHTICSYNTSVFVSNNILFLLVDFVTDRHNTFLDENYVIKFI